MVEETKPPEMEKIRRLPKELVEEILSSLPVKSLLRFQCVSKPWQSLIGSRQFMRKHLRKSTNNTDLPNHRVIIAKYSDEDEPKQYNLLSLLKDSSMVPSPMANGPIKNGSCSILCCCNGLVCIFEGTGGVFLWNPATRISKKLPIIREKHEYLMNSGFGWEESSDAYKVIIELFSVDDGSVCYQVYNSKTNSWKKLEPQQGHLSLFFENTVPGHGQFSCGKLHWFQDDRGHGRRIVSLDLKSELFGTMEAPGKKEGLYESFDRLWLGEIGGCLSAVCDHQTENANARLDVWVMKEYSSWVKVATIPQVNQGLHGKIPFTPLFGGGPNGEILLLNGDNLFVYYPNHNNVFSASKNYTISMAAGVYVESLASPLPA